MGLTSLRALRSVHHLRLTSITRHVYETGIQAIPIVALIAFLISVIVAYLGAQQLQQFGAEIFTVDLVAISVLREMGVLLTAIIVAGRSGSAFAAEIGVMRLNDEIDALQSMGVDYFEVLVLPRVIGLVIALPLLTIVADAMGLAGGACCPRCCSTSRLSQFIPRVQDALAPTTFWAGLIKAPVFAILIAMVGCYRGLQVRDSSRELGRLDDSCSRAIDLPRDLRRCNIRHRVRGVRLLGGCAWRTRDSGAEQSEVPRKCGARAKSHARIRHGLAQDPRPDPRLTGSDPDDRDPVVAVRGVVNRFGTQVVHDGVDLDVYQGEVLGIVGGSGSGKSVLLRTMLGLHRPN